MRNEHLSARYDGTAVPVPGKWNLTLPTVLCAVGWVDSILFGQLLDCGPVLRSLALAVHILALILAFGTILVVDWLGLLWLLGRVRMHEPGKLEALAKPLIWGGLVLLLASGALIKPDLGSPATCIKLICVLVLMVNGLGIGPTMHQLMSLPEDTPFSALGRRLRQRLLIATGISQACWWTAVVVGLVNTTLRRWAGT